MIRYVFRPDEPLRILNANKANAQALGEAFEKIAGENGGEIPTKAVVKAARDKKHVAHRHFEWNDSIAAEAYRESQARQLVRLIRIESIEKEKDPPRAFLSAPGKSGLAYHPIDRVMESLDLQLSVLRTAERDLEAFEARYRRLREVCDLVDQAREKIRNRIKQAETRPQ